VSDTCRIVRRALEAFWDSRWDELEGYFHPQAVYIDPLLPEPVRGWEAIRDVLAYCHEWGTYRGEIVNLFGGERHVAAELRIRGSVRRPPDGMSPAVLGKKFDFLEADVFELGDEGRIVRETIYADGLTLERQLGESFF
jgi:hypothetical protein